MPHTMTSGMMPFSGMDIKPRLEPEGRFFTIKNTRGDEIIIHTKDVRTVIRELKYFYIYYRDARPATECWCVFEDFNQFRLVKGILEGTVK